MKKDELTVREAATLLGITTGYVYNMLWNNKLDGRKEDDEWRITRASIEARQQIRRTNGKKKRSSP